MKRIYILISLSFFFVPGLAGADTVITDPITSDTTWSPAGGVYVIDSSFSVASGTTLTIEPGTIIKAKNTGYANLSIYGKLMARGTAELPIYFTSIWDNSLGGDSGGEGSSFGTPGDWQGLYFKAGSEGDFDYVNLLYAGYCSYGQGYGRCVGVENDGGTLRINNSNIHDNYKVTSNGAGGSMSVGAGIHNKSGILLVNNSVIENNVFGIWVESGDAVITGNAIKNNIDQTGYISGTGVYAWGLGSLKLFNNEFSGNKITAGIGVSINFIHEGNKSNDFTEKGFQMGGTLERDMTLHSRDLPVLINGGIIVPVGKTLTIEPGTVIKMGDKGPGLLTVYGSLVAKGTKETKIYFTSKKDDTVGGDSNGDGSATEPAPRDWNAFFLESGTAEFDNVEMRYGGYNYNGEYVGGVFAAIYNRNADLKISNSLFTRNQGTVIYQDGGTTTISYSDFVNGNYGVWSRGGAVTISQSNFSGILGYAVLNESGKDFGWGWQTRPLQIIDARNNWWGSADGPKDVSTSTPTGNGSYVSENVLYIPFLTEPPSNEQTINPVIIIPGIMGSAYKNGKLVIDPILHTYDDLIETLAANGYEKEKTLFTFPYEWRNSNVITALLLRDKIMEVKNTCQSANLTEIDCNKVDIVAHSMGGLVARQLIQSDKYNNDVDQLIFLGTPHKGSPKAYLQWEAGEFPPGIEEFLAERFFEVEAKRSGFKSLFEYIRNKPIASVQQLLPIFDYLKVADTGIIRNYSDNYPGNTFLENLKNNVSNLLNSGIKVTNIVGSTGNNTIEKIRVVPSAHDGLWEHGEPDGFYDENSVDKGLEKGEGDETVTLEGAILDSSINYKISNSSHQKLPTKEENNIVKIFTGKDSVSNIDNFSFPNLKVAIFQLLSPVDMVITDPNSNKIGKNFETGEEYDEIPEAFYSGYGTQDEYIVILNPVDGNYEIQLQGTDNGGEYGVLTSYISDEISTTTDFYGVTGGGQISNLVVDVDNSNPENLSIGSIDPITPSTLLNHIELANQWHWITNKEAYEKLRDWAQSIVRMDTKSKTKFVDKKLAQMLNGELSKLLEKGDINISAYNLLKKDLEYLINN